MSLANQPIHPTPADLLKDHDGKRITLAHSSGMTLRQYYAIEALKAILNAELTTSEVRVLTSESVLLADALIAALEE